MKKVGRPTKYRTTFPEIAGRLWANGATDAQVAKRLRINHDTLIEHLKAHPEFSDTRKACKAIADENVEKALYDRAIGVTLPDVHIAVHEGAAIITRIKKHYPPDVAAIALWLKNRMPKKWRERVETEITGSNGGPIEIKLYLPKKDEIPPEQPQITNGDGTH